MSVHKKIQLNRSSRLVGDTQHIYIVRMSCFIIYSETLNNEYIGRIYQMSS